MLLVRAILAAFFFACSIFVMSDSTGADGRPAPRKRKLSRFLPNIEFDADHEEGMTSPAVPLQTRATKRDRDASFVLSSLVAGVGSGAIASVACAPLDLLRTRMQVVGQVRNQARFEVLSMIREVYRRDGLKGYFRGLGATLLTVPIFWGIYFPLYDDAKHNLALAYPDMDPVWIHMTSAVFAGAISDVICNPMFVVRTRLQTEALHSSSKNSIAGTIAALNKEGGLLIFWRGMTASLFGLSHVAIQFPVYEALKRRMKGNKLHESSSDLLFSSGLSKMSASLLTYPVSDLMLNGWLSCSKKVLFPNPFAARSCS